jgi:hypothetical protein
VTWYITGNNNIDPTKFLGTINNQPLVIKTNQLADNSEKVRVNPDGNVGIGKAPASGTPYRLDVAGPINATDIHKNGAPLSASQWTDASGGISYTTGNVGIAKAPSATYELDVAGTINATDILKDGVPLGGGAASQWDDVTGGINFDGGNVGIGTTAPGTKLHVHAGRLRVSQSDGAQGSGVIELSNGPRTNYTFTDGVSGHLHIRTDSASHHVLLQAGGTQGNVGIGTTGPLYRLHVVAPGGFGGEDSNGVSLTGNVPLIAQSNSTAIGVINGNGRQAFALNVDSNGGTTNARGVPTLYDKYDGGWHQCLSLKNGNVGIGTYDPTHRFHVRAADAVGLFESTGGQAYLRLSTSEGLDNRVEITNRPGGRLSLWTAGAGDVFNITRGGNVGIGTTTPATRLSVAGGGATINGVALGTDVPGIDYPYEYETIGVTNTNFNLRLQSPNAIVFHTGDTPAQRMLVAENGDVTMTGRLGTGNWPAQPRTSGWGGGIRTWDVEAEGTIWSSHGYTQGSDARMKSNVEQLSNVLDKLGAFRGVSFGWIDGDTTARNQRNIGVIAQEVEKVFPELVSQHGDEGQKAVDYSGLAGILVEAAKELKAENEALRAKLNAGSTALRSTMDELRARIRALEPVR